MIKTGLSLILITLIGLQSVIVFADIHTLDPMSDIRLTSYHMHLKSMDTDNANTFVLDSSANDSIDGTHCCHCHGSLSASLNDNTINAVDSHSRSHPIAFYCFTFYSISISPDLRPPIV